MGTNYQASMNMQCLKEHTCVGCKGKFSYLLTRKINAQGASQQAALENVQKRALEWMEKEVDFHPCPNCGIIQPEMVSDVKYFRSTTATAIGLIAVAVALIMGLAQGVRIETSAYIALTGLALTSLIYGWSAFYNPNRNPQLNLARAQEAIASKQLIVTESTSVSAVQDTFGGIKLGNAIGFAFCLIALIACVSPIVLSKLNGWHHNESIYPAVAGAGDKPTFYFNSRIESLQGYWNGNASAILVNANELGAPPSFTALTKESSWGDTISGKSVSNDTNRMWAQVELPDSLPAEIVGKEGRFELAVRATFPYEVSGGFLINQNAFSHSANLKFSSPGAGGTYYSAFLYGHLAALALILAAAFAHGGVFRWLQKQGNPTEVTTLGEVADDEVPDLDSEQDPEAASKTEA